MHSRLALALALTLSIAGCGKVEPDDGQARDGSDPPDGTPATTPAPPVAAPTAPAPTRQGGVLLYSSDDSFGAAPWFPRIAEPPRGPPLALGECRSLRGTSSGDRVDEDAGVIAVTPEAADLALTVAYDPEKQAYESDAKLGAVRPGTPILVQGRGGRDVPAFEGRVDALGPLKILAPLDGDAIHPSTNDLVVRWSTTESDPVIVVLSGSTSGSTVYCQFDAAAGTGVVPRALVHEALARAPGAEACVRGCASVMVRRDRSTHVTAGTFDVEITHASWTTRELTVTE